MPYSIEEKNGLTLIRAEGKNPSEAFVAAAQGLFHRLTGRENIRDDERVKIAVDAPSMSALLPQWLSTLVQRAEGDHLALGEFRIASIQKVSEKQFLLTGEAFGEPAPDQGYAPADTKISSVSYHEERDRCTVEFSL